MGDIQHKYADSEPDAGPATDYAGGEYHATSQGTIDTSQSLPDMTMKPITPGSGGSVSVDTSSLKTFAANLETIADALGKARVRLDQLEPVRAGGALFMEAQTLAAKVTGTQSEGGLRRNFETSLTALRTALMDTADGINSLATKYSSIEEINQKAGSELRQLLAQAQADVQQVTGDVQMTQTAAGGADVPQPTTGTTGTTGTAGTAGTAGTTTTTGTAGTTTTTGTTTT